MARDRRCGTAHGARPVMDALAGTPHTHPRPRACRPESRPRARACSRLSTGVRRRRGVASGSAPAAARSVCVAAPACGEGARRVRSVLPWVHLGVAVGRVTCVCVYQIFVRSFVRSEHETRADHLRIATVLVALISVNPPEEVVIYSVLRGVIPKPRYLEHYLGNAPRQR